jgi:hypothetical protein
MNNASRRGLRDGCVLGGREITPPFTIPSGILTANPDLIAETARAVRIGLITTKSIGVEPYDGCPELIVSRWPDRRSAGWKGTAVDGLRGLATRRDVRERRLVFCGPKAMMVAALELTRSWTSAERILACVERHTSCGIGICGKCSLDGQRTCVDGPRFNGAKLFASRDFGRFHRGPSGRREPLRASCGTTWNARSDET